MLAQLSLWISTCLDGFPGRRLYVPCPKWNDRVYGRRILRLYIDPSMPILPLAELPNLHLRAQHCRHETLGLQLQTSLGVSPACLGSTLVVWPSHAAEEARRSFGNHTRCTSSE